jgi:hypothetical protein
MEHSQECFHLRVLKKVSKILPLVGAAVTLLLIITVIQFHYLKYSGLKGVPVTEMTSTNRCFSLTSDTVEASIRCCRSVALTKGISLTPGDMDVSWSLRNSEAGQPEGQFDSRRG